MNGTFLKLSTGFSGELHGSDSWLRAIVIQGQIGHQRPGGSDMNRLEPGSYCGSRGETVHAISCEAGECIIRIRTEAGYQTVPS